MGLFDFFKQNDINQGIEQFKNSKGAILVDVRTPEEYSEGHIPKSVNIPLQVIHMAETEIEDKNTELFVYCHSGARSTQATTILKQMGYTNVNNIGGISGYRGEVER